MVCGVLAVLLVFIE
uniref:Uncharacterized protein n=1 Tax=Anguilla anguilla TaxID=7936 RepID=A0A0E9VGR3_ANGAN